jgi:Ca2+-binding EF-hand superfamily protein
MYSRESIDTPLLSESDVITEITNRLGLILKNSKKMNEFVEEWKTKGPNALSFEDFFEILETKLSIPVEKRIKKAFGKALDRNNTDKIEVSDFNCFVKSNSINFDCELLNVAEE